MTLGKRLFIIFAVLGCLWAEMARGAVTSTDSRIDYTADGVADDFAFTFPVTSASHLEVFLDGVKQTSGYSVALAVSPAVGGTVTFTSPPADDAIVRIQRTVPLTQELTLGAYSPFPAKTIGQTFDRLVTQSQQIDRRVQDAEAAQAAARSTWEAADAALQANIDLKRDTSAQATRDAEQDTQISNIALGTPASANDALVTATASTAARALKDRAADVVNVKDFGADPTGVADSTSAIQAAIDAAATGRKPVIADGGIYSISRVRLATGVTLRGANGATLKSREPGAVGSGMLYFDSDADLSDVRIEGLSFDGNRANITEPYHHLVYVLARAGRTVRHLSIVGCRMIDAREDFIRIQGEVGSTVRSVEVSGNRFTNLTGTGASSTSHSGNGVRVHLSAGNYAGTYGTVFAEDVRVTNNYAEGIRTLADIKRGVRGFVVANNVARNWHDIAYSVDGSFEGVIADNVAMATTSWATTDGQTVSQAIEVQGEGITIRGNKIERTRINGINITAYAHPDEGGAQNLTRNVSITGNVIGDAPTHGIKLIDPQGFLVTGNHIKSAGFNAVSVDTVAPNAPVGGYVGQNFCGTGKVYITGSRVVYGRGNVNEDGAERFDVSSSAAVRIEGQHIEHNPNVHLTITAGQVDRWPGGATAVDAATKPDGAYRATTIVDNSAASLAEHALDAYIPVAQNDIAYLTLSVKQNTAGTCGAIFKEYDAAGAFISSTFKSITPTGSWARHRLSHTVASASAATVRVSLLPATGSNTVGTTGQTDVALVRIGKNEAVQ